MANSEMDFYDSICKQQFEEIKRNQEETKKETNNNFKELFNLLKGKNGDSGLMDDVRENTKCRMKMETNKDWVIKTIAGAIILQIIGILFIIFFKS